MGTGYSSSSAGDKPDKRKRQDAKQMEEQINELVDGDAVMHLELLEYMTDTFRTNHPTVSPDQQKLLALQVLAGVQQFIKDLKTMFKGRYPNAIRQDLQAVLAVAASKCTDRIRVKYYGDKTKNSHRRFRMDAVVLLRGPCQAH